jgi:hypothetical protein
MSTDLKLKGFSENLVSIANTLRPPILYFTYMLTKIQALEDAVKQNVDIISSHLGLVIELGLSSRPTRLLRGVLERHNHE